MVVDQSVADRRSMGEHALAYLDDAWSVFPVCTPLVGRPDHCRQHGSCKNPGKTPLVRWGSYQDRLPERDEVRRWWSKDGWQQANIGLATGELSDVVVIDLDGDVARAEASRRGYLPGPWVRTGRVGGQHLYFRYRSDAPTIFAKVGGLDFRGQGGFVLLPPSLHYSGARYSWAEPLLRGEPLPDLPRWIDEMALSTLGGAARDRIDFGRLLEGVPEGQRDQELFRAAAKLRGADVPYELAVSLVQQVATRCVPPFDADEARAKVDSAYRRYRPNPSVAAAAGGGGLRLELVNMDAVEPEIIHWLWRGRFARGKATLLMGDPGLGKSLISDWLAAVVSVGGKWPDGGSADRGAAVLFTIEDGLADTVKPRLMAAGADMSMVTAVRGVVDPKAPLEERMFTLEEHIALLEEAVRQTSALLVVMDPITAYLGPNINSHREADVRRVLGPLQLLAEKSGVVLAMLMHLNKGTGVAALYRAAGSIAFPAVARVVLGVAPDPNDDQGRRRLLLPVKMNISKQQQGIGYHIESAPTRVLPRASDEDQPPVLIWDNEPVMVDAASALDRNGSIQEMGALAECKRALLQILAEGAVPSNEGRRQLKEAGCTPSEQTLIRARRELGVRVRKQGIRGPWWWEFPEPPPVAAVPLPPKTLAHAHAVHSSNSSSSSPSSESLGEDSEGSEEPEDAEELLSRAREASVPVERRCRRCGRVGSVHGPTDPIRCPEVV